MSLVVGMIAYQYQQEAVRVRRALAETNAEIDREGNRALETDDYARFTALLARRTALEIELRDYSRAGYKGLI